MQRPPIIHIGLYKTASTWLQNVFFYLHPDISIAHSMYDLGEFKSAYNQTIRRLCFCYDPWMEMPVFRREMNQLLSRNDAATLLRKPGCRLSGFSHEHLGGEFISGRNRRAICEVLSKCYPEASIIIFIRNQVDMIYSMYEQYIRDGGVQSIRRLLFDPRSSGSMSFEMHAQMESNLISSLKHSEIIEMYRASFGAENVFVGLYEDLQSQAEGTLDALCDFLGAKKWVPEKIERVNPMRKVGGTRFRLIRQANRLFATRYHDSVACLGLVDAVKALKRHLYRANRGSESKNRALAISIRLQQLMSRELVPRLPSWTDVLSGEVRDLLMKELGKDGVERVKLCFEADNRRVALLLNKDLEKAGYSM